MSQAQAPTQKQLNSKSFTGSQQKEPKKIEPLTRSFFSNLFKLETEFINKRITAELLDELTQNYAKAVEFYDAMKDEIASYFIFKIQDTLAAKKSLKLLMDQAINSQKKTSIVPGTENNNGAGAPVNEKAAVITETVGEESSEDEEEDEKKATQIAKKRKEYLQNKKKENVKASFSVMRAQKQKFVNFYVKMKKQETTQEQSVTTIIEKYGEKAEGNNRTVQTNLDQQRNRLKARLEEKKNKSMLAQTMNSGYSMIHDKTDNILGDLDSTDAFTLDTEKHLSSEAKNKSHLHTPATAKTNSTAENSSTKVRGIADPSEWNPVETEAFDASN